MLSYEDNLKLSLELSLRVIREYDWLLDLYVLDFFVDDHWNKLPHTWKEAFYDMDPQTLGHILTGKSSNQVLPLSFLALLKTVNVLSIKRQGGYTIRVNDKQIPIDSCGGNPRLKNLFLKHVKLKKRHEISLMAEVVKDTAAHTQCNGVLDFGSGMGHLVRMLAYKYDLYAGGIECQSQLTEEARKLDLELEYTAKKHLSQAQIDSMKRPVHYNMTLSSHQQLQEIELPGGLDSYGLVGLHPCGDLGPLLLKHFVNSKNVQFICLVGCCFMKLTSEEYPMSAHVKNLDSHLSYISREVACHAIEVYCERLTAGNYSDLKIHAYRAALERILVGIDPALKHAPVRSIKHTDSLTFENYCSLACSRLAVRLPTSAAVWARAEADLAAWRRVVLAGTLRLVLAPLVETVVLADRLLYVTEQGLSCEIRPVFDPKISPRNHIMIAKRVPRR